MNTQEIINGINTKHQQSYIISNSGRIYSEFMGKKTYYKLTDIVEKWNRFEQERNAEENFNEVLRYLKTIGVEISYSSIYGSIYFNWKGYKIRVSTHHFTSENHISPDYNIFSYDKNGHVDMIALLESI